MGDDAVPSWACKEVRAGGEAARKAAEKRACVWGPGGPSQRAEKPTPQGNKARPPGHGGHGVLRGLWSACRHALLQPCALDQCRWGEGRKRRLAGDRDRSDHWATLPVPPPSPPPLGALQPAQEEELGLLCAVPGAPPLPVTHSWSWVASGGKLCLVSGNFVFHLKLIFTIIV